MNAAEDLDQRGFSGAVLAQQRMYLAGEDLEVDVAQRAHAAKALVDATDRQKRRRRPRLWPRSNRTIPFSSHRRAKR
ncbi:hypothetical protein [Bradyrhizobium sp. JR3.5]